MRSLRNVLRQVERSDTLRATLEERGLTANDLGLGARVAVFLEGASLKDAALDEIEAAMAKVAHPEPVQASHSWSSGVRAGIPATDPALADTIALRQALKARLEAGESVEELTKKAQLRAKCDVTITPATIGEVIKGRIVSCHAHDALRAVLRGRPAACLGSGAVLRGGP